MEEKEMNKQNAAPELPFSPALFFSAEKGEARC
jgi:hypothetical protein